MVELSIFHKPNQLMHIDRSEINKFQDDCMNIMWKKSQSRLFLDYTLREKGEKSMNWEEVVFYRHRISIDELIQATSVKTVKNTEYSIGLMVADIKKLSKMQITSHDKHSITFTNIFTHVEYDKATNEVVFGLNPSIAYCFNGKSRIIKDKVEDMKLPNESEGNFTAIPIVKTKNKNDPNIPKMSAYSHYLYNSLILKNANLIRQNILGKDKKDFCKVYNLELLRKELGVKESSYPIPSKFKSAVLNKIAKDFDALGIKLQVELIGKGLDVENVKLSILIGSIIKEETPPTLLENQHKEKRAKIEHKLTDIKKKEKDKVIIIQDIPKSEPIKKISKDNMAF